MRRFLLVLVMTVMAGAGCVSKQQTMSELVTMTTEDGIEIVGDFYQSSGDKFAILLHMMPATKESWRAFAEKLVAAGYSCLAIDMRGHGESNDGGRLNYRTFSDAEHQAKIRDVEAAFEWLKGKGADMTNTIAVGASIGANLAIQFAANNGLTTAVALSPGLDYHGVRPEPYVRSLTDGQKVILVASDDDPGSAGAVKTLHAANPAQTVLIEKAGLGHGTRMFDKDPTLIAEIVGTIR
jgi:dienelactone hydrolase